MGKTNGVRLASLVFSVWFAIGCGGGGGGAGGSGGGSGGSTGTGGSGGSGAAGMDGTGGSTTGGDTIVPPSAMIQACKFDVDDANVYYTAKEGGSLANLYKRPLAGGGPMAITIGTDVRSLRVNAGQVFLLRCQGNCSLDRVGVNETALTQMAGPFGPGDIGADATDVYVGYLQTTPSFALKVGKIARTAMGGTLTEVASDTTYATPSQPAHVVPTASTVLMVLQTDPNLWRAALPGPGMLSQLKIVPDGRPAIDQSITGIAVSGSDVFLAGLTDMASFKFEIRKMAISVPAATTLIGNRRALGEIVADSSKIYWAESEDDTTDGGSVWSAGLDGSNPTKLQGSLGAIVSLRQNSTHVFVCSLESGATSIIRMAK
jgi:hypothetical protein